MNWQYKKDKLRILGILALIGAASILIGFITDRSICIFYNLTGIPCPSCGMTRSFLHLFKGDIKGAFWYHPLFPLVLLIPFIVNSKRKVYLYCSIAILITVWIIRLYLLFPNTTPMVYMKDNLISIIRVIIQQIFG